MLERSCVGRHSFKDRTHKVIRSNVCRSTSESSCLSLGGIRGKVEDASRRASEVSEDGRGVGSGQRGDRKLQQLVASGDVGGKGDAGP